jgi:subtilisin family serine protease
MKSQVCVRNKTKSFFWLMLLCIPLWGFGLQAKNVSAYQHDASTPTLIFLPAGEDQLHKIQVAATATATNLPPVPVINGKYEKDEVLIRFKEWTSNETIQGCLLSAQATALSSIEEIRVWVVQVPFGRVAESIAIISACPGIRYVEPNYMAFIADTIPSDPSWELQYGLLNIHAPQGWDYSTGSTAVTIAIIDSGVDLSHPDLADKIVPGYDFVNEDEIAQDDFGHGTHVAGIAAASGNDGVGVSGVSWGARIMPIKVLNASGNGSFADVAAGITWAADHGAQVINLSLGGASSSTVLQDAVNYAYGKGVVLIAAAGNAGSNFVLYPARYPNVIAVGAVDSSNNHASFSNYGLELNLVAPGDSIYSTVIGGYGYKNGTSMAAPYVSGLAAILLGYPGEYSPADITFALESSALDLGVPGFDSLYGHGLIQMDDAIQSFIPSTPTPTPVSTSLPPTPTRESLTLNSIAANDGWILESAETSGAGSTMNSAASRFNLGDDSANRQYRSILHFDTSSLPDNAVITSAILKIKKQEQSGTDPFTILGALKVDMRKPSFGIPALALNDFKTITSKNDVATFNSTPVADWYSASLNNTGATYLNRSGTTQFRIYFAIDDNNDNGNDFMKFFSGNAGAARRPRLIIEYYVP